MKTGSIEMFAVVVLENKKALAGFVSGESFGKNIFARIDVPETTHQKAFSKFINFSAISEISPVSKEVMTHYAEMLSVKPINEWNAISYKFTTRKQEILKEFIKWFHESNHREILPSHIDEFLKHETVQK